MEEMRAAVKNFFHSMNGVSYDDDLGDGFIGAGLINAAPDGEKLRFYASHKYGIMYCLCEWPISYVDV